MKKIGLVLSGGGAKGIAHIGVIKALEEKGVYAKVISGSSAGALVGAFYAAGNSPEKVLEFTQKSAFVKKLRPGYGGAGLVKSRSYRAMFHEFLGKKTFEELEKQLFICTTNLNLGKSEFFSSGPIIDPLIASSSIPVVFTPMKINGHLHSDGGIMNNFPIEPLEGLCDYIIGVEVNSFVPTENPRLASTRRVLERSMMLMTRQNTLARKARVDLLIEPHKMCDFRTFDIKKADMIFERGYTAAQEKLKEINF